MPVTPRKSKEGKNSNTEFMLEEYKQLFTDRNVLTSQAEQRVNFFLTIISAAFGGILLLSQLDSISPESFYQMTLLILAVMLLYGFYIFHRVVSRDVHRSKIGRLVLEVLSYFASQDPEIAKYSELRKKMLMEREFSSKIVKRFASLLKGGLIQLTILSNSLICGGIILVVFLLIGMPYYSAYLWAGASFLITLIVFYFYYRLLIQFFLKQ